MGSDPSLLHQHDSSLQDTSNFDRNGHQVKMSCSSTEYNGNKENMSTDKPEVPMLSMEPISMKRKKKAGGYNLRKSLAWDRAFLTEEGILDPVELSVISGTCINSTGQALSVITEVGSNFKRGDSQNLISSPSPQTHQMKKASQKLITSHCASGSGAKSSGCPRPSPTSSLKRPAFVNTSRSSAKELKFSKTAIPKPSMCSIPRSTKSSLSVGGQLQHNQFVQSAANNQTCSSSSKIPTIKNTPQVKAGSMSSPSISSSKLLKEGSTKATTALQLHPSTKICQPSVSKVSNTFLKTPREVDAVGISRTKVDGSAVIAPAPQRTTAGKSMHHTQFQAKKPSGLRMPSPSLGFFAQPKVSVSNQPTLMSFKPNIPALCNLHDMKSSSSTMKLSSTTENSALSDNDGVSSETRESVLEKNTNKLVHAEISCDELPMHEADAINKFNKVYSPNGTGKKIILKDDSEKPEGNTCRTESCDSELKSPCSLSRGKYKDCSTDADSRTEVDGEIYLGEGQSHASTGMHWADSPKDYINMKEVATDLKENPEKHLETERMHNVVEEGYLCNVELCATGDLLLDREPRQKKVVEVLSSTAQTECNGRCESTSCTKHFSFQGQIAREIYLNMEAVATDLKEYPEKHLETERIPIAVEESSHCNLELCATGDLSPDRKLRQEKVVEVLPSTAQEECNEQCESTSCTKHFLLQGQMARENYLNDEAVAADLKEYPEKHLETERIHNVVEESSHCNLELCATGDLLPDRNLRQEKVVEILPSTAQEECNEQCESTSCTKHFSLHGQMAKENYLNVVAMATDLKESPEKYLETERIHIVVEESSQCNLELCATGDLLPVGEPRQEKVVEVLSSNAQEECNERCESISCTKHVSPQGQTARENLRSSQHNFDVLRNNLVEDEDNRDNSYKVDTSTSEELTHHSGSISIEKIKNSEKDLNKKDLQIILPKDLVPFSEEWLAAIEAAGEDVLTLKTGAVQNSPPEKSLPEPSPWSPVKRKTNQLGPFDCTKYTNPVPSDPLIK